ALMLEAASVTKGPPFTEYFTLNVGAGALSTFLNLALITVAGPRVVEVNSLPEEGARIASTFRSKSDILPGQLPPLGNHGTAVALLPGTPLILARTVAQYKVSLARPEITYLFPVVMSIGTISSPRNRKTS